MNLARRNANHVTSHLQRSGGCQGMTLIEMLMAMSVGVIIMAVVAVLSVYALRSFTAMGNYADLESKSRFALDRITRDLRQATGVVSFDQSGPDKYLRLTNALEGVRLTYTWYADDRVLEFEKGGHPVQTYLTECDDWSFTLFQRTPMPGVTNQFHPTTNSGACKMIEMTWKCSRTMLGKKWNTESAQCARVVLRTNP
jgi:prepilin-type N-terminal cleavage/methylation domain-containing protein